jgi:hypothetical protein
MLGPVDRDRMRLARRIHPGIIRMSVRGWLGRTQFKVTIRARSRRNCGLLLSYLDFSTGRSHESRFTRDLYTGLDYTALGFLLRLQERWRERP